MQRTALLLAASLLPLLSGCDEEDFSASESTRLVEHTEPTLVSEAITLTLETRDGTGAEGWSFEEGALIDAELANLVLSSWDCGARGRWVTLEANEVDFCYATEAGQLDEDTCGHVRLEIGGSQPEIALGELFFVRTQQGIYPLALIDRTDTPYDWYEADDLSFQVLLEVAD